MRIFVTGAAGQVGTELLARIPDHHEVLGVDLVAPEGSEVARLDLADRGAVLGAITSWRPDAVIHCAAFTAVDRCESEEEQAYVANCLVTRYVADGARRVGAHVVAVSTDYVFDGTKSAPYVEWDTPNPQSVYGRTKLGGEQEIDPGSAIARTSWVCSAHGNNMVKTVLKLGAERETLSFVDDQFGHPTFAGDLAEMLITLAVERAPGIFHTTNQGAVSWFGFVQAIFDAAGWDRQRVLPISSADLDPPRPAPRPANSVLDDVAWRHHGFRRARDFREPLGEVVAALLAGS